MTLIAFLCIDVCNKSPTQDCDVSMMGDDMLNDMVHIACAQKVH